MQFQRLIRREEHIHRNFLRDDTDRGAGLAGLGDNIIAHDFGGPGRLIHQPRQDIDHRAFARPIGAEQAKDGTPRDRQIDPVERRLGGCFFAGLVSFSQSPQFNRGGGVMCACVHRIGRLNVTVSIDKD